MPVAVVLKGYPRLSETFIAQEIHSLERAGVELQLVSLRQPTDPSTHPIHREIKAPVLYLPEYLYQEPLTGNKKLVLDQKASRLPGSPRLVDPRLKTRSLRQSGEALWPGTGARC